MKTIALAALFALLLPACGDWPPRPDAGGTDWYPPERCGEECNPVPTPLVDAGPVSDTDAGEDADADAG